MGPDDLQTLYVGFGFECKEGRGHTIYIHPEYPELRATVARHRSLAIGYIQTAISLIEKLQELKKGEDSDE